MEKKNMDKIDILYNYAENKRDELMERLTEIRQSLFTGDMKIIISELLDHGINHINIEGKCIFIGEKKWSKYFLDIGLADGIIVHKIGPKKYDKDMINDLSYVIEQYNKTDGQLSFIEDFMDEIVSEISDRYKEITEKDSNDLDELFDLINYNTTPIKHLKITVEWI